MKKITKYILVFTLLIVAVPAHSMQPSSRLPDISFNISLADFSFGGIFPFSNDNNAFEFSVSALRFGAEHFWTGLGMWFSPFTFLSWRHSDGNIRRNFSFINIDFYWVPFPDSFYFGPFFSLNYFILSDGKIQWNKHVLTIGMQGGIRIPLHGLNLPLISLETGVRLIDKNINYHFSVKLNILLLYLILH